MKPAAREYKCWCGEKFSSYEAYAKHLTEGHLG